MVNRLELRREIDYLSSHKQRICSSYWIILIEIYKNIDFYLSLTGIKSEIVSINISQPIAIIWKGFIILKLKWKLYQKIQIKSMI